MQDVAIQDVPVGHFFFNFTDGRVYEALSTDPLDDYIECKAVTTELVHKLSLDKQVLDLGPTLVPPSFAKCQPNYRDMLTAGAVAHERFEELIDEVSRTVHVMYPAMTHKDAKSADFFITGLRRLATDLKLQHDTLVTNTLLPTEVNVLV